jgi:hypothetical protein
MSDIDWDHVNALLGAIHGAATAGPKYAYITARAEAELTKHMQDNPEPPAVEPETPVTAPPAALTAIEPPPFIPPKPVPPVVEPPAVVVESPSGDGTPGPDATMTTAVERRV